MNPIIDADRVGFSYRGTDRRQLSRVSFQAARGARVAIMGATGAGKTTLAMMLNGLVPHHHPGDLFGVMRINGIATHEVRMADLVRTVGLVMQDPEAQLTARRAIDDAAVGPANLGLPRDDVWRRAHGALRSVGLGDLAERDTTQMSGGQQQRLAIAGILAMEPELLVLDEPTSELDPSGTAEIYAIIADQCARGRTVVLVDHDSDRVADWADQLLVLVNGEVEFCGDPATFFGDGERVRRAGLRQPAHWEFLELAHQQGLVTALPTDRAALARAIDSIGGTLRPDIAPIEQTAPRPNPETGTPAVQTRGLTYRYPSGVLALDGVDTTFAAGEFVALLGRNGAGKTTFARHLVNLLHPTSGSVLINGRSTEGRKVHELAHEVGYVFQNPDHQIFANSVFDEVAFGLRNFDVPEDEIRDRVHQVLQRVHIEDAVDAHPFTLGRGERQRVAVASVLALRPQILIIDEPTTGQDWEGAVAMLDLVQELNEEGCTILMITHDMLLASQYAQRALVFQQGQVALDTAMGDLFSDIDRLAELHLDLPRRTALTMRLGLPPVRSRDELADALERATSAS